MKRIIAICMAFIVTVLACACEVFHVQAAGYHEYNIEEYVLKEMEKAHIPGMNMSIVSDEKEIYSATFGANASTDVDFVLGSLTHSITALGIMRMVEDGELSLKDPLSVYLPQYESIGDVTIEQLLWQTSGIPMEADMDDLRIQQSSGKYRAAYANYNLLGEVIEKVSGESYEEYIADNILDLCDMGSTYSLRQSKEVEGQAAYVYQTYFGYPSRRQYEYRPDEKWVYASGGLMLSDVKDMGKYLQMYLRDDEKVMDSDSIAGVLHGNVPVEEQGVSNALFGTEEEYGMGWISTTVEGVELYYQMGFLENTTSFMLLVPERNAGIIMFFNEADYMVGSDMIRSICKGVTDILLDQEPEYISSDNYLKYHGIIDLLLLLAVVAAWMPVLLMEVWSKRARRKFSILRLVKDIVLHIVLPTAMILWIPEYLKPWTVLWHFIPDIVIVLWVVIGTLYLGALVKLIQSIILFVRHKMHPEEAERVDEAAESLGQTDIKENAMDIAGFQMIDPEEKTKAEEKSEAEKKPKAEEKSEAEENPEAEKKPEAERKSEVEENPEAEKKPETQENLVAQENQTTEDTASGGSDVQDAERK